MDAQLGRRSVSMRPQSMDIIVVLIWLSLISICSSKNDNLSSAQGRSPNGVSASSNSSPSPKPAQPPPPPPPRSPPPSPASNEQIPVSDSPPSPSPPPPAPHKFGGSAGNPSTKSPLGKRPRSHNGGSGSAEEKKNPLGKKLGIWFLGIAGCLQVAAVAFLSFKRRQIPAMLEKSGTQLGD